MRLLLLHNRYRHRGGEDVVFEAEADLLRRMGVTVAIEEVSNLAEGEASRFVQLGAALDSAWSRRSREWMLRVCEKHRPDVVHVHNFWMQLTPSVHAAAREFGAATVQTLHNFRLLCAGSVFLRNGQICEDCLGKTVWRGVLHKCYRHSLSASAAMARMIQHNRARGTWRRDVDAFVVFTEFHRAKFVAGGLPAERIHIKPNFVVDTGEPAPSPSASDYCLYVGRLSPEKGAHVLLEAWRKARVTRRLIIVGDGPERAALQAQAPAGVEFAGWRSQEEVRGFVRAARAVIVPSVCYEGQSMAVTDAFCAGRPVVATRLGSLEVMVHDGRTGLTPPAGDTDAWVAALERVCQEDDLVDRLGRRARHRYQEAYTPERNFSLLTEIYQCAMRRRAVAAPLTSLPREASC